MLSESLPRPRLTTEPPHSSEQIPFAEIICRVCLPTYADVAAAAERLDGIANRTPVLTSRTVDLLVGGTVFFKAESFQRAGAFKFRGAYNALSRWKSDLAISHQASTINLPEAPPPGPLLIEHESSRRGGGVLTFSSGNHGMALALAGRLLEIPVTIVMPSDAPQVKVDATRGYGGEIVFYERDETTREALGKQLAEERGLTIIPPYDHPHIVAGAGTAAKELCEEVGPLDLLLVPCGGGGLLSGSALSAEALSPGCNVCGVEPETGDDGARSFASGALQSVENPQTIADGARTPSLGPLVAFPIIKEKVAGFFTVSDEEIVRAMRFLWERMKLVIEPTGALALAALLEGKVEVKGKRVGVILSGGNVDLRQSLGWLGG